MPLRTETYDLDAEAERLAERCQEVATAAAELDADDPRRETRLAEGQQLDAQLAGVRWAQTAHDDDDVTVWDTAVDSVELGGLTGGEWYRIEDDLTDEGSVGGATNVIMVAEGTIDAPYLRDGEKATIAAVSQLPLSYLKWAEARINDLSGVQDQGNAKRFGDWLQDARAKTTSTEK